MGVFDIERQADSVQLSLPRRRDAPPPLVPKCGAFGGLKTVMAAALPRGNQCPYESGSFMISSSMSFSSCCSVKRCISLPDLCVVSKFWLFSRTLSTWTCSIVSRAPFDHSRHLALNSRPAYRTRTGSSTWFGRAPSRRFRCIRRADGPIPWT